MTLKVVDRMGATHCNIIFNYDLEQHDAYYIKGIQINGHGAWYKQLGVTSCDNNYGHVYCEIKIHVLNADPNTLFTTIQHEFGHALGLGHRWGDTKADAMDAFLSDDLMYREAKKFSHLTNEDILALINLYGPNGFSPVTIIPDWYTIPYHVHLKTST
jgi:hypothetical protein